MGSRYELQAIFGVMYKLFIILGVMGHIQELCTVTRHFIVLSSISELQAVFGKYLAVGRNYKQQLKNMDRLLEL